MRTRVMVTALAADHNFVYVYKFILVLAVLHLGAVVQVEGTAASSLGLLGTFGTSDSGLTSPGGVFKFGFFKSTSSGSSEQYALAIWYAQLPTSVRTIVWIAARDVALSSSASFQVSQNGVLQLLDYTQSQQPLWQSVNRPLNATGVELRDSGNLVLVDATNATVWQSFDTPTDTLLPGQNFSATTNFSLSAWKDPNDWSEGYYQAGWVILNNSVNFALSWTGKSIANWNTSSWSTTYAGFGNNTIYPYQYTSIMATYVILDESSGSFYIGNNSVPAIGNTSEQAPGVLRRVTLDSDGGLRLWRWQSTVWNEEGNWVPDPCQTFAICGPYGICGHDPTYPTTPSCTCPTSSSFTWIDASDHFKGCKPVTTIPDNKCSLNTSEFQMLKAGEIDYPFADRIMDPFDTDEESCKAACFNNCNCAGAVYWRRDGRCYVKSFPLFNGGYPQQVGNRTAYVKVLIAGASPTSSSSSRVSLVAGLSVSAAALAALVAVLLVLYMRRRRRRRGRAKLSLHLLTGPRKFSYRELSLATKNFAESERVGSGGMGAVYKGILRKSGSMVAVKRIRHESQDGEDGFLAEASSISQIRHRNLVQLQGWCHEDSKLMLVYDYMPNGSLNQWLYGKAGQGKVKHRCSELLSWERRYSILQGVAAALAYLHEDWQQCVLHRDIKSSNVMLDEEFNAHLGDFGLARLIDHQKVEKTTLMAGTLGYMAPEMPYTGKATKESDVYSFGILILEVVSGRKPVDHSGSDVGSENHLLLNRVWRAYEADNLLSVVDPLLEISRSGYHHHKSQLNASGESFQSVEISCLSYKGSSGEVDHDLSLAALTRRVEEEILSENEQKVMVLKMGLLCCLSNPAARPSIRLIHQIFMSRDSSALPPLPANNSLTSTTSVFLGINSGINPSIDYQQPFPFASELHCDSVTDSHLSRYTSSEASR